jgi:hypothetical protein
MNLQALARLDQDIRQSLLKQIRDLWTHTSTALEGNTLRLGETKFVIEEGLTVSGKPLKDHQELMGHARAIQLIFEVLNEPLTQSRLFDLHRTVQSEAVADIYKPCGAWKLEPNGTYAVMENPPLEQYPGVAFRPSSRCDRRQGLQALYGHPCALRVGNRAAHAGDRRSAGRGYNLGVLHILSARLSDDARLDRAGPSPNKK